MGRRKTVVDGKIVTTYLGARERGIIQQWSARFNMSGSHVAGLAVRLLDDPEACHAELDEQLRQLEQLTLKLTRLEKEREELAKEGRNR